MITTKATCAYLLVGILVVSIGSNIERGCKERQSTFVGCIGFVLIWPLLAVSLSTATKNFPCDGMSR